MTTTIAPSLGAGVLHTQQGVGTTPGYSALDTRRVYSGPLQEGVFGTSSLVTAGGVGSVAAADFMVTRRSAGASMSVDINMPPGGAAYVQGDAINGQGLYCVPSNSSNINEAVSIADVTNPRLDQVILEVQDNALDASGGNIARTRVVTGTPTSGATLANRSGAAALPGTALLLADVLVGAGVGSIDNTVIRDRRKWARGAYAQLAVSPGDYTTTSTIAAEVDAANRLRFECSGRPVRVVMSGLVKSSGGAIVILGPSLDGAYLNSGVPIVTSAAVGSEIGFSVEYDIAPPAGSHVFSAFWSIASGTATLRASGGVSFEYVVEEIARQSSPNNAVTTG